MKQLTSRQNQAKATKLKITEKAMELIKIHGFDSVRITDICESANISTGAFYHYFQSKEKIIENAYMKIDLLVEESVESIQYNSSYDKILEIFKQAMKSIEELGYKFMADIFKHSISSPSKYSIEATRYPYDAIRKAIEKGVSSGEFLPTTDSIQLSWDCMRIGRGMVFDWCFYEGSYSLPEETEKVVKVFLKGFKSK
ncbi:TetR/AcrR family transcriptional regulator [Clostridium sp. MSJ-4]|uniref:TetR/AcrR family transcriptional regulator n=1 Tax=Clostridium simiarum TaxID=2841506 RepID=A0ABS6EZA6_9CLOT|nr:MULTISPECIES: TetR/AcrR family transcriptional regulator [Clostridium]MBU5591574.1 TetR/AcrR family transcriptional regulator [Clostridium simiarum]